MTLSVRLTGGSIPGTNELSWLLHVNKSDLSGFTPSSKHLFTTSFLKVPCRKVRLWSVQGLTQTPSKLRHPSFAGRCREKKKVGVWVYPSLAFRLADRPPCSITSRMTQPTAWNDLVFSSEAAWHAIQLFHGAGHDRYLH